MTYQPSVETAIRCAGRFMAEGACDAVKLKAASRWRIVSPACASGIPCMGHLGLTPQSVSALGGYKVQGKGALQAKKIIDDAKALEDAGAYSILLEMVPDRVCELITNARASRSSRSVRDRTRTDNCSSSMTCSTCTQIQAEDGKGLWRRRQDDWRWVKAVRRRSDG